MIETCLSGGAALLPQAPVVLYLIALVITGARVILVALHRRRFREWMFESEDGRLWWNQRRAADEDSFSSMVTRISTWTYNGFYPGAGR